MNSSIRPTSRHWLTLVLLWLLLAAPALAQEAAYVVRVEETWALNVGEPNLARNGPQVSMVISPFPDLDGTHFVFLLNHKTAPNYSAGGMQLQFWQGDDVANYANGPAGAELATDDELLQWKQVLTVADGTVTCEVVEGQSSTWGGFGGQGNLRFSVPTGQTNLNGYTPAVSIEESLVGYAGNRVSSLVLQRVRWIMSDGQVYELNAPIDIDSDLDPWSDDSDAEEAGEQG